MAISFDDVGSFDSVQGGPNVLDNPTSLQFGPDGRLYVAEQNGGINAFTVAIDNGQYVATDHEELTLPGGGGIVQSIQNHNDDGSLAPQQNRQVTGIVVGGTAENPVLYISSSDPRIATNADSNLDTNSGIITQATWNGTEWVTIDLIRGLPRSEENHSNNGLVLDEANNKLYVTVGGNTNNGAPSQFFAYTAEYALSGTVLEVDLDALFALPVQTDADGGQGGTPRDFIYDLPTLDDPTVANDGVREDANGLDVNGPFGGNDGFNQAILPADAPLRIFADGFRNHYDLVQTENGLLYTVDNGSNGNLGGNPLDANGLPTEQAGAGAATNAVNDGGTGDPEPLFLIEGGGYYGHPVPVRANQTLEWIVYDDNGNPDTSLSPNTVFDVSTLVPDSVQIAEGFIIDPSKFTGDPTRLTESGIRVERDSPESNALLTIGSSSNGLIEYTFTGAFDGELAGDLLVAQFNGNITRLNLSPDGQSAVAEPVEGLTGLIVPLDIAQGPDGTLFVAEIGGDMIRVFAPGDGVIVDTDFDNDGLDNTIDPFIRDASNGGSVTLFAGQTLLWDFDANQDDNLPGPDGYGGGLTGVAVNGSVDFEQFFQEPSDLPGQIIRLDNVKFITAAGGGTTVVENVSNGDALAGQNNGEYLFHTGLNVSSTVESFTIKWSLINPGDGFTGPDQQIGGYIGTGDQSNYLKVVATQATGGEIQILLEDNDTVVSSSFLQADELFSVAEADSRAIFIELEVDPVNGIATPTITYEISDTETNTVSGTPISLAGTNVLDAINGDFTVSGEQTGLAVGLYSSNTGQDPADTFQAVFTDVEVTAAGSASGTVLYRVNSGGPEIAAIDGGIAWGADTSANNSPFLLEAGINGTAGFNVLPGTSVAPTTPAGIFQTERFDTPSLPDMQYQFETPAPGLYEVRLFLGNGFDGTDQVGERVFDVALEGAILPSLNDIDLVQQFGNLTGGQISNVIEVTDGFLNIEFLNAGANNPLVNGIEILQLGTLDIDTVVSIISGDQTVGEGDGTVQISLATDVTVPSDDIVQVTVQIVPTSAEGGVDYTYDSPTATFDQVTGIYTDTLTIAGGSSDATVNITLNDDAALETSEAFTVSITDVSANAAIGTSRASVTITDNDVSTAPVVVAINAGGLALSQDGIDFQADAFFVNGGTSMDLTNSGNGPQPLFDGTIFETERIGGPASGEALAYSIPVAAGSYTVELYFAEIFQSNLGQRVFDVFVEGQLVLDDFDILAANGGDINEPVIFEVPNTISPDAFGAADAIDISLQASADNAQLSGILIRQAGAVELGSTVLGITENSDDVQVSTFGNNSFQLTNTGDKEIAQVDIDITNALFPDTVFDPFGDAGDTVARELTINNAGGTGVVDPSTFNPYTGVGGQAGFEGITLLFDSGADGGFETGETVSFAVDLDPNSIAGAASGTLNSGTNPPWDTGGVSGAELIGSTFTVTFADGTTATGQLQGNNNQGGGQGLATQAAPAADVTLTVNGLGEGGVGTYDANGPSVIISGLAGQTARIVLAKGFIQPETNEFFNGNADDQAFAPILQAQLDALALEDFPANNAVEFQTVDIVLTGGDQDISSMFDFSGVADFDFAGENQVPLGFVASVIDPSNNDLPISAVTPPIYLQFDTSGGNAPPVIASIDDVVVAEGQTANIDITAIDDDGVADDIDLSVEVTDGTGTVLDPSEFSFTDNGDGTATFALTNGAPLSADASFTVVVTASDGVNQSTETFEVGILDLPDPVTGTVLYRVNAGGTLQAPVTGTGPDFAADLGTDPGPNTIVAGATRTNGSIFGNEDGLPAINLSLLPTDTAVNATIFETERFGPTNGAVPQTWDFDVTNGDYRVNLYFAEIFAGQPGGGLSLGEGFRVFDVTIEDALVLDDFDILAQVGTATAIQRSFNVTVDDGNLDIDFSSVADNAKISAIEIIQIDSGGPLNQQPDAVDDTATTAAATSVEIDVLANDTDPDGDDLQIIAVGTAANGTVAIDDQGTADTTDDVIIYTPDAGSGGTQTVAVIDADFNGGTEGFVYSDDIFRGTNQPIYADGAFSGAAGVGSSGGLTVVLGGLDFDDITGISGGWTTDFDLATAGDASLTLTYRAEMGANFEADEFSQVLVAVDGSLVGQGGNDFLVQQTGNGNGGPVMDTGFVTVTLDLGTLSAGSHSLALGAFVNEKTWIDEIVDITFDDVLLKVEQTASGTPFEGTDSFSYTVSDGNGGTDTATVEVDVSPPGAAGGDTDSITLAGSGADDELVGGVGDDTLDGFGGDDILRGKGGDDFLRGRGGEDMLFGGSGRDVLKGGTLRDKLVGGGGSDELSGGNGRDLLFGGNGNDELTGGGADDLFIFTAGRDLITDFGAGGSTDRIAIDTDALGTDLDTFVDTAQDVDGDVVFDLGTGDTLTVANQSFADIEAFIFERDDFTVLL